VRDRGGRGRDRDHRGHHPDVSTERPVLTSTAQYLHQRITTLKARTERRS